MVPTRANNAKLQAKTHISLETPKVRHTDSQLCSQWWPSYFDTLAKSKPLSATYCHKGRLCATSTKTKRHPTHWDSSKSDSPGVTDAWHPGTLGRLLCMCSTVRTPHGDRTTTHEGATAHTPQRENGSLWHQRCLCRETCNTYVHCIVLNAPFLCHATLVGWLRVACYTCGASRLLSCSAHLLLGNWRFHLTSPTTTLRGRLKRNARAVQLFGRLAVLETHTLRY